MESQGCWGQENGRAREVGNGKASNRNPEGPNSKSQLQIQRDRLQGSHRLTRRKKYQSQRENGTNQTDFMRTTKGSYQGNGRSPVMGVLWELQVPETFHLQTPSFLRVTLPWVFPSLGQCVGQVCQVHTSWDLFIKGVSTEKILLTRLAYGQACSTFS